eukprot:2532507-Heterocapsa_arctica.AAC.1
MTENIRITHIPKDPRQNGKRVGRAKTNNIRISIRTKEPRQKEKHIERERTTAGFHEQKES